MKLILKDLRNVLIAVISKHVIILCIAFALAYAILLLRKMSVYIPVTEKTANNMDTVLNIMLFFVISFMLVVKNKYKLISIISFVLMSLFVSFLFYSYHGFVKSSLSSVYIYITVIAPYIIYKSYHYIKRCKS